MAESSPTLGGRLPLLRHEELTPEQTKVFDLMASTFLPWAESAKFKSKTEDGRLIGPFNVALFSPAITAAFLTWQNVEGKETSLDARVRQVVILTVGAVWKADYEIYAHAAVARQAGLPESAIAALAAGDISAELTDSEGIAQRFTHQLSTAHRVDDDLYAAADAAFGARGLADMVQLIGAYHSVCAMLNAFAVPAPE